LNSRTLLPTVLTALAASQLPAHRLELEITEAVLMQNTEVTLRTLHQPAFARHPHLDGRFRHRLLVLELSAQLPLRQDQDRPLLHHRPRRQQFRILAIVQAVAGLAQPQHDDDRRRRRDRAQLDRVRELGCTDVQGYFYSPPVPAANDAGDAVTSAIA
jgi:predicted signal transduction protein with EAL and GGDEF domain